MAAAGIGIHATNLIIESHQPMTEGEILDNVGDGIYIGNLVHLSGPRISSGLFPGPRLPITMLSVTAN